MLDVADAGVDCRLVVQGAILSAIAYGDALTIKVAGIRNAEAHQRLPATLRHALGNQLPQSEVTRLMKLLRQKDDSANGHRAVAGKDASAAVEKAVAFAAWAERTLIGS